MKSKNDEEITQFFLVTKWDEVMGPKVELEYPSASEVSLFLPDFNPLAFATQIFMVASSLFGSQEYQKEVVDLPVVTLRIRVRVIFDYKEVPESEVRGGRLPFMFIIGYPQDPEYKPILDKFQPDFVNYLNVYIQEKKYYYSLEDFFNKISTERFNEFKTIDDFFENLKRFSSGVLFGMITGSVLRNNIPVIQVNFEKYLQQLIKQSYMNQKLGQIFISEYQEFFYCFWVGPFAFLLRPPLKHLKELHKLLLNISESLVDHLWSLTLVDPNTETINLLSNFETNPSLVSELFSLAYMSITRNLSGLPNLGLDKKLQNPEIIFYINFQARECIQLMNQAGNFVNYLLELKNLYLDNNWNGILAAISYFIGEYHQKKSFSGTTQFKLQPVLKNLYSFYPEVIIKKENENFWLIINCPFMQLDKNIGFFSFLRSYLLVFFPKYNLRFKVLSNTSFSLERR